MKNKLLLSLSLFSLTSLSAMDEGRPQENACTAFGRSTHIITPFNLKDDAAEFIEVFLANKEILVQRPAFDINQMLRVDSVDYEKPETHGSLKIFVLRDLDTKSQRMTLRGFAAYSVLADKKTVRGDLLAVRREDRKQNYAAHLIRYGIARACDAGATNMWLSTLKTNVSAQMVYKKVAAEYSAQYELEEKPFNRKMAELGLPENPRAVDAIAFTLKPKPQQ